MFVARKCVAAAVSAVAVSVACVVSPVMTSVSGAAAVPVEADPSSIVVVAEGESSVLAPMDVPPPGWTTGYLCRYRGGIVIYVSMGGGYGGYYCKGDYYNGYRVRVS